MRILLYGLNFSPELTGIGKYTGEMAAWLAARGHLVRVVTAPPYYPEWEVAGGYKARSWRREQCHDVEVWRCPLWVPARPGGVKRLLHLASFALSSLPVMLRQVLWRPDVVWVVEPALFCAPMAVAGARLCGAKAWLHVQDFEVDAAFDLGLLKGQWMRRWVAAVERWLMRRFDVVSTISQRMHQHLLDKGVAASKAVLAPNWVDMAQFALPSAEGVAAYRRELNIAAGATVALYSGNMGGKQGLEVLAEVARLCLDGAPTGYAGTNLTYGFLTPNQSIAPVERPQADIVFVFCGNGAGRSELVAHCVGLTNVRFLDLQPADRLQDLLATADIHLLPQRADVADLVMPSKLTGMLASARAVIATAHAGTELASVVHGCGLVVPPGDAVAFAQAVRGLAANSALREQLGAAGFLYAQAHLDREAVLQQFEAKLLALVGHAPTHGGV